MSDTTDAAEETSEQPGEQPDPDPEREALINDLRGSLGDGFVDSHLLPGKDLWVRIATGSWVEAATVLHGRGFTFFSFLSAIDWLPSPYGRGEDDPTAEAPARDTSVTPGYAGGATRFQVLARLVDLRRRLGVTLKADVPDDTLTIGSWVSVFAGANWHERETHEMFGIAFEGHPDLRKLYLPTDFEGYPLRKDFPLLSRMIKPWPGIVDVEPLPADDEAPEAPADDTEAREVSAGEDVQDAGETGEGSASDEPESSEAQPSETSDTASATGDSDPSESSDS